MVYYSIGIQEKKIASIGFLVATIINLGILFATIGGTGIIYFILMLIMDYLIFLCLAFYLLTAASLMLFVMS